MEDQLGFWRKGPWTADEDRLLIEHVKLHGEGRWNSVARLTGLRRNAKSCRLRWVNYLRPDLKRGRITPHEERTILELHARWGNRWSTIARSLPGRTDNEIKNYWRTHFKTKGNTSCEDSTKLKARLLKRQKFQQEQQKQVLLHQQEKMNEEEMKKLLLNMLEESDNKVVVSRHQESVNEEIQSVLYSHQQMVELESSMNWNEDFVFWDYGLWSLEDVGTTEGCVQMQNLTMPMPMSFF